MKQSGNILIISVIIITAFLFSSVVYYSLKSTNKSNKYSINAPIQPETTRSSQETTKIFSSKNLKISFVVPLNSSVEEKFTTVIIKIDSHNIKVSRSGTNFDTLDDYLKDLGAKNNFSLLDKKTSDISEFQSISGRIERSIEPLQEKIYFIYADGWIFTFSTSFESLYDDLDQIAQSFKYTP